MKFGTRNTRSAAFEHGTWTSVAPLVVDAALAPTHLLLWTAWMLNVLSVPATVTGTSRNRWLFAVPHAFWATRALSAVDAPTTSTHLPAVNVLIV
jgi:hypothetical protein